MSIYLDRYAWQESILPNYSPAQELELVVVIPCYNEPSIEKAIYSLNRCVVNFKFSVLVVVNEAETENLSIKNNNLSSIATLTKLQNEVGFELLLSHQKLPDKKAGVGLARKIGMDEAVRWFEKLGTDGVIVCYDADCTCQPNYLQVIYDFYSDGSKECGIVHYEHDLTTNTAAIINYEIYLRYYINSLRYAGFPYAYQTLGSCITVKSKRYQKEGGMNTRKAGEDFYFLHKVIPNGKFDEINNTAIHPSARISDRVPFGTGHAIDKYLNQEVVEYLTYNPIIFEDLKHSFDQIEELYHNDNWIVPDSMTAFLNRNNFTESLNEIRRQSTDLASFRKRFFAWFDGFRVLKFIHFARDHFHENIELIEAVNELSQKWKSGISNDLNQMRFFDKTQSYKKI